MEGPPVTGKTKVIVAMSGGVDSSVSAALLSRDYDVVGLHITKRELGGLPEEIRASDESNAASARAVAETVSIPIRFVEAGRHFERLLDYFCGEYNAARTPNPCVVCNVGIKWRIMLETADSEGAEHVATGHYARIDRARDAARLLRGRGGHKDQTYFLHRLTQRELMRTMFPLAEMTKDQTRGIAREMGLPSKEKAESQEICFVGEGNYRRIIESRTPGGVRPGQVLDTGGNILGTHEGYQFYTIGQRKGLGIALGEPAYVVAIDAASATVRLGSGEDLACRTLRAAQVNWLSGRAPEGPFRATVRIRYGHTGQEALVTPEGGDAVVEFDAPVRAVTPGQAAVFYAGDELLGGGWIERGT
jgi:tRNA-specific 2-thiouridylase